jgi:hypothetical protein
MHDQPLHDSPSYLPDPRRGALRRLPTSAIAADALRYWEPRRIAYNAVLGGVVAIVFAMQWRALLRHASVDFFLALFLFAVLANIAYCAAYPADVFVQHAGLDAARRRARTVLFLVGTLFAAVIAQFVARGMLA